MKYEEAAKRWAAARLTKERIGFTDVLAVSFDVNVIEGCPTCGPETRYEGYVRYVDHVGNTQHEDFTFYGLDEILQELFALSERR